jgi:hypothetical protein
MKTVAAAMTATKYRSIPVGRIPRLDRGGCRFESCLLYESSTSVDDGVGSSPTSTTNGGRSLLDKVSCCEREEQSLPRQCGGSNPAAHPKFGLQTVNGL